MKKDIIPYSQRVVASNSFYKSSTPRIDNVMIEGSSHYAGDEEMMGWLAKVLCFVRVCNDEHDTNLFEKHIKKYCPICFPDVHRELAFIQYYEVLSDNHLKINTVDKSLDCIGLPARNERR